MYHGTIARIYKEVALSILHNIQVKLRWRDKRMRKQYDDQQKIEWIKQLATKQEHSDNKSPQSIELSPSTKEIMESSPRCESNHLFKLVEARASNLNFLSAGKKVNGLDLTRKTRVREKNSPIACNPLSQSEIAHVVLRGLICKQKTEEENANISSKEFATVLRKLGNNSPLKTPKPKDHTSFSGGYEASCSEQSPPKKANTNPDAGFTKGDSPARSILSRIISTPSTESIRRNRAVSTQKRSLRKQEQFTENDSLFFGHDASGHSKTLFTNTTSKCINPNETTFPLNFHSVQDIDHGNLIDLSTQEAAKKLWQISHSNERSTSPHPHSGSLQRMLKK